MARNRNKERGPGQWERSEFSEKVLDVRRVARVMAGGRRFSFRVTVVVGNRRGRVAVAVAKGRDVSAATEKAAARARKNLISVPISPQGSIAHEVRAKYAAARVLIRPRPAGSGIVAGGAVRAVMDLAGITNVTAKILSRSPNKLSNAMAALEALKQLRSVKHEAGSKNQGQDSVEAS